MKEAKRSPRWPSGRCWVLRDVAPGRVKWSSYLPSFCSSASHPGARRHGGDSYHHHSGGALQPTAELEELSVWS